MHPSNPVWCHACSRNNSVFSGEMRIIHVKIPQLTSALCNRKPGSPGNLEQCEPTLWYKIRWAAGELKTHKFLVVEVFVCDRPPIVLRDKIEGILFTSKLFYLAPSFKGHHNNPKINLLNITQGTDVASLITIRHNLSNQASEILPYVCGFSCINQYNLHV